MKLKTHKGTQKRFKVTGTGKYIEQYTHQDHFNAREAGTKTRKKRRNQVAPKTSKRHLDRLLPNA